MSDRERYLWAAAVIALIAAVLLSGCSPTVEGVDGETTVMYVETGGYNETLKAWVYVVTDKDTGVQYVVTRGKSMGDVSICPRYGSDGEIVTTGQVE